MGFYFSFFSHSLAQWIRIQFEYKMSLASGVPTRKIRIRPFKLPLLPPQWIINENCARELSEVLQHIHWRPRPLSPFVHTLRFRWWNGNLIDSVPMRPIIGYWLCRSDFDTHRPRLLLIRCRTSVSSSKISRRNCVFEIFYGIFMSLINW